MTRLAASSLLIVLVLCCEISAAAPPQAIQFRLSPDQRAVAIASRDLKLGKLLGTCKRVDVLCIDKATGRVTKKLLEAVLAIVPDNVCTCGLPVKTTRVTVCFALTPEEAARLLVAASEGEIRIVLSKDELQKQ